MDKEKENLVKHIASVMQRRNEVAEILSSGIAVPVGGLFYKWIRSEIEQDGVLGQGWKYFFHGLDCTLGNEETGEAVRLEFGPEGRVDCFTKSVLVDMKKSDLYYAKANAGELFDSLCDDGYIGYVNSHLHQKISTLNEDGLNQYMNSLSDEEQMDAMVSDRLVLIKK